MRDGGLDLLPLSLSLGSTRLSVRRVHGVRGAHVPLLAVPLIAVSQAWRYFGTQASAPTPDLCAVSSARTFRGARLTMPYRQLAGYHVCIERLHATWSRFQERRRGRLVQRERLDHGAAESTLVPR